MDDPRQAQSAIYGEGKGPPMLYEPPRSKPTPLRNKKRKLTPPKPPTEVMLKRLKGRAYQLRHNETEVSPSDLPGNFPPELAYRALAAYSLIRTLSIQLRLSPFTPNVFLRALYLPYPNKLIGQVHVALLRVLLPSLGGYQYKSRGRNFYKRRVTDNVRWPLRGGDNLTYLDGLSWPLFYDDYCHLTADALYASYNDTKSYIDFRTIEHNPYRSEDFGYNRTTALNDDEDEDDEGASDDDQPGRREALIETKRVSHKREYKGMDDSDSDSDFEDNDEIEGIDDDGRPSRNRQRRRKHEIEKSDNLLHPPSRNNNQSHVSSVYSNMINASADQVGKRSVVSEIHYPNQDQNSRCKTNQKSTSEVPILHLRGGGDNELTQYGESMKDLGNMNDGKEDANGEGIHGLMQMETREAKSQDFRGNTSPTGKKGALGAGQKSKNHQRSRARMRLPMASSTRKTTVQANQQFHHMQRIGRNDRIPIQPRPYTSRQQLQQHKPYSLNMHDGSTSRDEKYEVKDEIATVIGQLIRGEDIDPIPSLKEGNGTSKLEGQASEAFQKQMNDEKWKHFEPIKSLREGTPHHRLSLEAKLVILEFLIDQLLSLPDIAAEMSKRRRIEECYTSSYGNWPNDAEFDALENTDECGICSGEGELLCCDGCVSSYHRECLNMAAGQQPPEGKWLCPECELVDPARLGPLRGGFKGALDWFSIKDIHSRLQNQAFQHHEKSMIEWSESTKETSSNSGHSGVHSQTNFSLLSGQINDPILSPFPNYEFLVVHGFVFSRSTNRAESSQSILLLKRSALENVLQKLDPLTCQAWPFAQIPSRVTSAMPHFRKPRDYLSRLEWFDPNVYKSQYLRAPIHRLMRTNTGHQIWKLMNSNYETVCNLNNTFKLSDVFIRDFSLDDVYLRSLKSESLLYNPYDLFRGYLIKIEYLLRKACLLDENWESGQDCTDQEKWLKKVNGAKSIHRLSLLILQLVDRVHPRAFVEGWFHNQNLKGSEIPVDSSRTAKDLAHDWSEKQERRKRIWETIAPDEILHVCEKEGCSLDYFTRGIQEHISPRIVVTRSKRKMKKYRNSLGGGEMGDLNNIVKPLTDPVTTQDGNLSATPSLRRLDATSAIEGAKTSATQVDNRNALNGLVITPHSDQAAAGAMPRIDELHALKTKQRSTMNTQDSTHETKNSLVEEPGQQGIDTKVSNIGLMKETNAKTVAHDQANEDVTNNSQMPQRKGVKSQSFGHTSKPNDNVSKVAHNEAFNGKQSSRSPKTNPVQGTRRRTRRSMNRLVALETSQDSKAISSIPNQTLGTAEIDDSIEIQVEVHKMKKIADVEKIVKGGFVKQMEWPICGRVPFATMGNLSPKEMKRLGRMAGVVKAPSVAYQTAHEVGQISFAHIWRKEMEQCQTFEQLILQLLTLESFLDRLTIHSCENVVRRGKSQIQKIVKLTQRNASNGVVEYFVVHKGKDRGFWISSQHVDVSALILDAFRRRQERCNKRSLYLKDKEKHEQTAKRKAEEIEKETKIRKLEVQANHKHRSVQKTSSHLPTPTTDHQLNQKQNVPVTESSKQNEIASQQQIWTGASNNILMQHQMDLMILSSKHGGAQDSIPKNERENLRKRTLFRLKGIGKQPAHDEHLRKLIVHCEGALTHINPKQNTQSVLSQSQPLLQSTPAIPDQAQKSTTKKSHDHNTKTPDQQQQQWQWEEGSKSILVQHQMDTLSLASKCISSGAMISTEQVQTLRQTTMSRLNGIGNFLKSKEYLTKLILDCESEALKKLQQNNNVQGINAQQGNQLLSQNNFLVQKSAVESHDQPRPRNEVSHIQIGSNNMAMNAQQSVQSHARSSFGIGGISGFENMNNFRNPTMQQNSMSFNVGMQLQPQPHNVLQANQPTVTPSPMSFLPGQLPQQQQQQQPLPPNTNANTNTNTNAPAMQVSMQQLQNLIAMSTQNQANQAQNRQHQPTQQELQFQLQRLLAAQQQQQQQQQSNGQYFQKHMWH